MHIMKISPLVFLYLWIVSGCLLGFSCYYGGKRSADRWYKAHTGDVFAPWSGKLLRDPECSITANGTTSSQTVGRVYLKNQSSFHTRETDQWAYPQVRTLSGVPKYCNVAGDAFVLDHSGPANGRLFVCVFGTDKQINYSDPGKGRWISAIPFAYAAPQRNGKE